MTDKPLLDDKIFGHAMEGLGHDVSFTVSTAGGGWKLDDGRGPRHEPRLRRLPSDRQASRRGPFLIGRRDFDPSETVVLLFDFGARKVFVSGKDDRGDHAFMEGTVTRFEALED